MADQHEPVVAKRMNSMHKVVFSNTMDRALWNNTKLVKGDRGSEIQKMKNEPGTDMVILGSGSIVSHLANCELTKAVRKAASKKAGK
jgi:dihydrofolate reductase